MFRSRLAKFPTFKRAFSSTNVVTGRDADVIVIGGGHAGCEAAHASARIGAKTLLVTQRRDTVGEMSCNPSIGGVGKGTLVREIDALGGLIGRVADISGIQFKVLNQKKGAAVQGPRAQMDRDIYKKTMQKVLLEDASLKETFSLLEGSVHDLLIEDGICVGISLQDGTKLRSKSVVITTGTFLGGMCHIGNDQTFEAGRFMRHDQLDEKKQIKIEPASSALSNSIKRLNFPVGRLRTGTPPRLSSKTIDYSQLEPDIGDENITFFSFKHAFEDFKMQQERKTCYITSTNEETHKIVSANYKYAPRLAEDGEGYGTGPRYCPTIEKKLWMFPDKAFHNIWLEPEGLNSDVVYPNGLSTGLPLAAQLEFMRTIKGLENVEILQPAYVVGYDFIQPQTVLRHTLETRQLPGFFLAGQINGTTGYEEAACQGIIAGINAAQNALGKEPFEVTRAQALTGTLIDDLIVAGVTEPYRMFTSRSEYRLTLRAENADRRLSQRAIDLGLFDEERVEILRKKEELMAEAITFLHSFSLPNSKWFEKGITKASPTKTDQISAFKALEFPGVKIADIQPIWQSLDHNFTVDERVESHVNVHCQYEHYSKQQESMAEAISAKDYNIDISQLDYAALQGRISKEDYERLKENRPQTLQGAVRAGLKQAAIAHLFTEVKRLKQMAKVQNRQSQKAQKA